MSPRAETAGPPTLAFVESPVQLLNVLEWAHTHADALQGPGAGLTLVVLSPNDPMTRGQLRRMAELARDEGYEVRWEEARGGATAPFHTIAGLAPLLRRARRIVMGDPFSRYVQLLLTITRAEDLVVVDDGTATMEFVSQLARGERLVRWHRKGGRPGPRDLLFAPVSSRARRRLTPAGRPARWRSSPPCPWTRPPRASPSRPTTSPGPAPASARPASPRAPTWSARPWWRRAWWTATAIWRRSATSPGPTARPATSPTAARAPRNSTALAAETGLEIVRPDLPLELIARRGPIGRTILSFPSTVVHTLPLALAGTDVRVAVCDVDPTWLTENASPRAQGFLSGVTGTARDVHRLSAVASA